MIEVINIVIQNKMALILFLVGAVGLVASIIIGKILKRNKSALVKRKAQSKSLLEENIIRAKMQELAKKKIKLTTINHVEEMALQAGVKLMYEDFLLLSFFSGIATSALFIIFLNNIVLSLIFLILGAMIPYQILLFKRNRRIELINTQIGPFLHLITERYENADMKAAIESTIEDFKGEEPLFSELNRMSISIGVGTPITEAFAEFAIRTGNPFAKRLTDFYEIASIIGTSQGKSLLKQAYLQYEEDRQNKLYLKKEIASVKAEGYLVLCGVPVVIVYQTICDPDYINFMTNTFIGQVGTAFVGIVFVLGLWFLNRKVGAPIE